MRCKIIYSFCILFFLLVFFGYLEHSCNLSKYSDSISVFDSQKPLTDRSDSKQWWFQAAYDGVRGTISNKLPK